MPWLHSTTSIGVLVLGFLLSLGLVLAADGEMNRVFSSFWYQKQPDLRKALQNAKAEAKKARPDETPDAYSISDLDRLHAATHQG